MAVSKRQNKNQSWENRENISPGERKNVWVGQKNNTKDPKHHAQTQDPIVEPLASHSSLLNGTRKGDIFQE